jgi:hypothetical protein
VLPVTGPEKVRRPDIFFEQITNAIVPSIRRVHSRQSAAFKTLGFAAGDFATMLRFSPEQVFAEYATGMIRMNLVMKICLGVALSVMTLVAVARADEFKLSHNQRISCSRGLAPGKLRSAWR